MTGRRAGPPDLIVAGAGMAGLVVAARASELGATVRVHEKGDRAGGSMLLSSGVIWRHADFAQFRRECPGGDERIQRAVHDQLEEGLTWLESLGAPVLERETGNPDTVGVRFETLGLTEALAQHGGDLRLEEPLTRLDDGPPTVLATGGFQGDRGLVRRHITPEADYLLLRANRWSSGDGLRLGLEAGGAPSAGMEEFYGRSMPAPPARVEERDFVSLAQLYARQATVENERGERYAARTWSEIDVVQWVARQPRARAYYTVTDKALQSMVRDRSVSEMVEAAREAGAHVERQDGATRVEVAAAITTTLGGLRVDADGCVADGVFACGADAGGISTGGYSSGLAAALVLGRRVAERALGVSSGP